MQHADTGVVLAEADALFIHGKRQRLHLATPYYPLPRGKFHTRGNVWGFAVGCCTPRPRTTPSPEENSILGVMYGVWLWADMNAATPLGSPGRSDLRTVHLRRAGWHRRRVGRACGGHRTCGGRHAAQCTCRAVSNTSAPSVRSGRWPHMPLLAMSAKPMSARSTRPLSAAVGRCVGVGSPRHAHMPHDPARLAKETPTDASPVKPSGTWQVPVVSGP